MRPPSSENILTVIKPKENGLPLVFDSPHSGRIYPDDFNHACDQDMMERAEDNHVDTLFADCGKYGASFLKAEFPRTYIDVNRGADDIDLSLFDSADEWTGTPARPTNRSQAGIGLIRRLLRPGTPLYDRYLSAEEVTHRIEHYYTPYHQALETLTNDAYYNFGQVWHINCHSMPSAASKNRFTRAPLSLFHDEPDFVLGDRDGTSCSAHFTRSVRDFLKSLGYRVAINHPYRGVELVRRYAEPSIGKHSLQLEINKALYWNEEKCKPSKKYDAFKQNMDKFVSFCADYVSEQLIDMAAD